MGQSSFGRARHGGRVDRVEETLIWCRECSGSARHLLAKKNGHNSMDRDSNDS